MKSRLKSILLFLAVLLSGLNLLGASTDSTYWYVNGEKYSWHYQDDVFAFRNWSRGPSILSLDTNCVEYKFHRENHRDDLNIIYFKSASGEQQRTAVKQQIRFDSDFEAEFPVITSFPQLPFGSAGWFVVDDLILVNFNHDSLTQSRFDDFKATYGLKPINYPDSVLPAGGFYTIIFEVDINELKPLNTIDLCQLIYFNDSMLVKNVQPNLINAYREVSNENTHILNSSSFEKAKKEIEYFIMNNSNQSIKVSVDSKNSMLDLNLKVYDIFGREVFRQNIGTNKILTEIDIRLFANGIYFSCLEKQNGSVVGVHQFRKM